MGACSTVCVKRKEMTVAIPINELNQVMQEIANDNQVCEESQAELSKKSVHTENQTYEQQSTNYEMQEDGTLYMGRKENGKKNGFGYLKFQDGSFYEGQFKDDMIDGFGKYTWGTMRCYEGYWQNNMMHGEGVTNWPDGRYYKGSYQFNQKEGFGEYRWYFQFFQLIFFFLFFFTLKLRSDGRIFRGNWLNGVQDGEGLVIEVNGRERRGLWSAGKRLQWF